MSAFSNANRSSSLAKLTPADLHNRTGRGEFAAAYYFYGPEDYRVVEAEKHQAGLFVGEQNRALSIRRMNLRQHSLANVLDELQSLPLLGLRRAISIAEAQSMRPDQFEQLAQVLSQKDPDRLVILTSPSARMPKWDSAFMKNIGRIATVVEFTPFNRSEAEDKIDKIAAQFQLRFERGARERLRELIGVRKSAIDQEMEKLRLYSDGSPLTKAEIDKITCDWTDTAASLLAQSILQRDRAKSMDVLRQCMQEGTSPSTLIWQLGNYLSEMVLISLGEATTSKWTLAQARKQDASRFRPEEIESAIIAVAHAEHQLRNSAISDEFVMEGMVATLIPATFKSDGKFSAR